MAGEFVTQVGGGQDGVGDVLQQPGPVTDLPVFQDQLPAGIEHFFFQYPERIENEKVVVCNQGFVRVNGTRDGSTGS